jgi:S1-C subfamily serine protease
MSDAVFLTADHCVASKHATPGDVLSYVVRRDVSEAGDIRTIRHAAVLAVDETHDLALLRALDPPPHTAARLSSKKLVAGLPVFTMGHPVKLWWSFSSGEIAAVRILADEDEDPVHYVQATAPVSPGCSGGGLFDDEGNLVGVTRAVWGRQFGAENTNLFVHRDSVAVFLQHEGITS